MMLLITLVQVILIVKNVGKGIKNKAWDVKVTKEPRKVLSCTTFCTGEEPDMVYAEKDVIVHRLECPVGHLQPYQTLDI